MRLQSTVGSTRSLRVPLVARVPPKQYSQPPLAAHISAGAGGISLVVTFVDGSGRAVDDVVDNIHAINLTDWGQIARCMRVTLNSVARGRIRWW